METAFTPFQSLAGGLLIGASAVMLMATLGRIMGATGILAGLITSGGASDKSWRAALLAGMVTGPLVYLLATGETPALDVPVTPVMLALGGLLVGIGVAFGAGCTSGHGVCGMARLSPRSIVATLSFMLTTGITVYIIRHVLGG